jgi:TRAP-type C4-dicarboxylate transport system permease small subunit
VEEMASFLSSKLSMQPFVKIIRAIFGMIEKIFELMSMGMLVAMVVIICYQVVMRELGRSPSWSEEVAILLMIWFGILSIPIGVKLHLHIGIEYFFNTLPKRIQWVVSRLIYLLIAAFGIVMITSGIELVEFMSMSTLPATKLPSAVKYAVIPLAGITLIYNALELFFVSYHQFLTQSKSPGSEAT